MWKQSLTSKTSESIQHLQNTFIFLFFVQFFNQFKCLQNTYKIEFFPRMGKFGLSKLCYSCQRDSTGIKTLSLPTSQPHLIPAPLDPMSIT